MNVEELKTRIRTGALSRISQSLEKVIRPAIRVVATPRDEHPLGSARLGGLPDLPRGSQWPRVDGIPLMFAGQFELSDLATYEAASSLPKVGRLAFFFDGMLTGYEQGKTLDRCRVLYFDDPTDTLVRLDPPKDVAPQFQTFSSSAVAFDEVATLPAFEEIDGDEFPTIPAIEPIIDDFDDQETYRELRSEIVDHSTRLLGHPDEVQGGELRFSTITKRDGGQRFRYDDEEYEWTNEDLLRREMADLNLLFQSASEGRPNGINWGGGGVVYFWISREELEAGKFDAAFATLETT